MASNAEAAAAKQPNHDSNVVSTVVANAKALVDAEGSRYIKEQDLKKTNNAAFMKLSRDESRTKPFDWDGIEKRARKAKKNGIFQRRLAEARQDKIIKSLEEVEVDTEGKSKIAEAENVGRPAHASQSMPKKDIEEDESIASLKKKTIKEERPAKQQKKRKDTDREGTKIPLSRAEVPPIIQPPLLHSEAANVKDTCLSLPSYTSEEDQKVASQRIAYESLHKLPPGNISIIHDLPLANNHSLTTLRRQARSTSFTNLNTLHSIDAMGLAFSVFPKDVKGLPTLKILGTTDPTGELQYKVYGTKFPCRWRVMIYYNARAPLGSESEDENPWKKWTEGDKWIEEDIPIMRTHDDKSNQSAEGLSERRFELPLDIFKDKKPNEDGSINYRLPQQFRIKVGIEPLFTADHPLGMNNPENLSDTAKDAIYDGSATISQVRMRVTAVVYSKNGSHVVESGIRNYLTDISTISENIFADTYRTERKRRCTKAFQTTKRKTPFKLAIAIEWPSWCTQLEKARSVASKGKSVALQQEQENSDDAEVEVPHSVRPQPLAKLTSSRAHMDAIPIRAQSENTTMPAAESNMLPVSGTLISTNQYASTAPSVKNIEHSLPKKRAEVTARPAETMKATKDNMKVPGTSQSGENTLSTIEDILDESRPDDNEHNGSWASNQDVPDVVTQNRKTLTTSSVADDGPRLCDQPQANGDERGLLVSSSFSRLLSLQTAVKNGIAEPTQGSFYIPQLGTGPHSAALASALVTGSHGHEKRPIVPSLKLKSTGLRNGISTLEQGSVDAARLVEIINLVSSDDEAAPAPASRPLCRKSAVLSGIAKQTDNPSPIPPDTIAPLAEIASARISESPKSKEKEILKPLSGDTSIDMQKNISMTPAQANAQPAKAVEVIDLVDSDDEATVLSIKATGKNGTPRSAQRVKRSHDRENGRTKISLPPAIIKAPLLFKPTDGQTAGDSRDALASESVGHKILTPPTISVTGSASVETVLRSQKQQKTPAVKAISVTAEKHGADFENSKNISGRPKRPAKPSLPVSSTIFVADTSSSIRRQSPQKFQKCMTSRTLRLRQLSSANEATAGLEKIDRQIASNKPIIRASHVRHGTEIFFAPNAVGRSPNLPENLYDRDQLLLIASEDNYIGQEEWLVKECRKRDYSRSESFTADSNNGRDKQDYNDDGIGKKRGHWNQLTECDPAGSTACSTQDHRRDSSEKSPNLQRRKKRRMAYHTMTVAEDVVLAYDANVASTSNQVLVNLADGSEVDPLGGLGMSAPNEVRSSNAKRLANDELGPGHDRKRALLDNSINRADTLSTAYYRQAAAKKTHIARQPMAAESSTEWHSSQSSLPKKAKQANGPCFKCKTILSIQGWHHRLPRQAPPEDGAVWCRNCYARHYSRIERDGGPCFLCRKTRSKSWHYKLQNEERHDDRRVFCSKCYYKRVG